MTLDDLGPRICILGPSNSGKSTLAMAIARSRGLRPVHLDQLRYLPNTDWVARSEAEFIALHDQAIRGERWAIDGNYSSCMARRLERATGVILLDTPVFTSLFRYLRRSWFERTRHGGLDGGSDSVKWIMLHHIAAVSPANRKRYRAMADGLELPTIRLLTTRDLAAFYRSEGLSR